MEMTGDQIDAFRKDFNEAMKTLEEKYDITLRLGTIIVSVKNKFT